MDTVASAVGCLLDVGFGGEGWKGEVYFSVIWVAFSTVWIAVVVQQLAPLAHSVVSKTWLLLYLCLCSLLSRFIVLIRSPERVQNISLDGVILMTRW